MFENIVIDPQKLKKIKIAAVIIGTISGAVVTGVVIYKFWRPVGLVGNKFVEELNAMGPPTSEELMEIKKLMNLA